jgi:exopolysaccharide biosynthesis polyprenyl glycosylphosphotransferase
VLPGQRRSSKDAPNRDGAAASPPSPQISGTGPSEAGAALPAPRLFEQRAGVHELAPEVEVVDRAFGAWLRRWGLWLELSVALTVGVTIAATATMPGVALLTLATWVVGAFYRGRAVTTPLQGQLRVVASSALLPLALLCVAVGALAVPPSAVRSSVLALAGAATVTALSRSLRWTLQAPVRVVAVGDRAAVATAVAQLPRTSRCRVVAGVVVEEGLDREGVPQEILGVATYADLHQIAAVVDQHAADLVVVDPGRAVSADDFRAMTWDLEGRRVTLGVSGVVRAIAPHRMAPGKLGRSSVLDVRLPRQSRFVRTIKAVLDRSIGLLAFVVLAPVLALLMAAIRWETPGPAVFRQVRIGKGGRPFTVYKLRTMVVDAEERKAELTKDNEADSVLFKLQADPRVTRVGAFLRTWSLDELPQLVNVVRGEMSLVGPRPHLRDEVDRMDERTRRRHAVSPGMTGLWQVSGRSDLSREEASELDTYYTDNWTLSGDASILARTVRAVLNGKGAY